MRKYFLILTLALALFTQGIDAKSKALISYMNKEENAYRYELVDTFLEKENTVYVLSMVSQKWRSEAEVRDPYWKHWVKIIAPKKIESSSCLLVIGKGATDDPFPKDTPLEYLQAAENTNSIVAIVYAVPNQKIFFLDDNDPLLAEQGRREDEIIAYTWKKYLETKDPTWPLRLPMTKSVIKAMDTVERFLKQKYIDVDGFVLTGESKRGWTAWLSAAIDKRVKAIAPVVCDFLNIKEQMKHHYHSYGTFSPVLKAYLDMGIDTAFFAEKLDELLEIEDPYFYKDHVEIPKLLINSTGDMFTVADGMQFYLKDLKGENCVRYIPNSDHYIHHYNYFLTVVQFFKCVAYNKPLPTFQWKKSAEDKIELFFNTTPKELNLWKMSNEEARDFRKVVNTRSWKKQKINYRDEKVIEVKLPIPEKGWSAFLVEAVFEDGFQGAMTLTSEVFITPNKLPFASKQ